MEVIVSSMVLVTAFAMAASLSDITARALRTSDSLTTVDLAISENIADINDLASSYTYCSGKAGFSSCSADNPGNASYYTPVDNPTLMANFQTACQSTNFNTVLLEAINALPVPTGVTRTAATDADPSDLQARRIRVNFAIDTNAKTSQQVAVIVPNVASFCP